MGSSRRYFLFAACLFAAAALPSCAEPQDENQKTLAYKVMNVQPGQSQEMLVALAGRPDAVVKKPKGADGRTVEVWRYDTQKRAPEGWLRWLGRFIPIFGVDADTPQEEPVPSLDPQNPPFVFVIRGGVIEKIGRGEDVEVE